jgi:hypothetical protein
MSEADAQVAAGSSTPRLAELSRVITRGIKTVADSTGGPSFADSLFSASQSVDGEAPHDGEMTWTGRRAGEGPQGSRDRTTGATSTNTLTNALDPASSGAVAARPGTTTRPPAFTAIRPEGRSLGPVPAAPTTATTAPTAATTAPAPTQIAAAPGAVPSSAAQTQATAPAPTAQPSQATQPAQQYVPAAPAPAGQPVAPAVQSSAYPTSGPSYPASASAYPASSPAVASTSVPAAQQQATAVASGPTYATHGPPGPVADGLTTAQVAAAYPSYTPARPTSTTSSTSAPMVAQVAPASVPATGPVAPAYPASNAATSPAANAAPMPASASSMAYPGLTADARVTDSAASTSTSAGMPTVVSASTPTVGSASSTGMPAVAAAVAATGSATAQATDGSTSPGTKALALDQYPTPAQKDRSGVLNSSSDTPPTGKEIDRLIAEARHRKVGWVTFVANPDRAEEYGKLADRLTKAGIQPIARVEDPYGDLPVEDVTALVKELRGHGVRYFQLFDGANVASETPDDHVDVRDYAERWLTAAKAVVAEGGLPGVGALAPDGDYDDLGFMRHFLSTVKDRGGADVLGQSWLALRGEHAGATASPSDTGDLADRASWFDRVSRQALGRSLPILATQDPSGPSEQLAADPASATPTSQADQAERIMRGRRRSLPALFAASRGTLDVARA